MKNFGRKMLGFVLTASMACSVLPVVSTYAEEDVDYPTSAWIEGEDLLTTSYTAGGIREYGVYSGGKAQCVDTEDDPETEDGYYFDYEVELAAGTYDIYFRGADYDYDDWMSDATAYVDGEEKSYDNIMDEYEDLDSDADGFSYAWVKVSGVALTEGKHILRWAYLSKSEADPPKYSGVLDCIVILPVNTEFTPTENDIAKTKQDYNKLMPTPPEYTISAWIEGEDNSAGGFTTKPNRTEFSGGQTYYLYTTAPPADSKDGYYLDFSVFLQAGTYDIYFRGVDDVFALSGDKSWMSDATAYVDGEKKSYTTVLNEGWGSFFTTPLDNYAYGWLKVSNVELTKDAHTIRWAYLKKTELNPNYYFGGLDCIAIVPSGALFTPVSKNITNTKLDYDMSLLLMDYNLSSISENIALPSELADGREVTWLSSDTAIIANDGTVTRPETSTANVTLTATVDGYSKEFNVTVRGVPVTNAWIEGEDDLLPGSYTGGGTRNLECYSGGKAQCVNTASAPGADGYYFDHIVNLESGTYDIYFHGADDAFSSDWMSNATAYVDGNEMSYQSVLSEGWDAEGGCAYGWLKASNVEITDAIHTIRWAYKDSRKSGAAHYIGVLDCIVIIPSGLPFEPKSKDFGATKVSYNMCTLLGDYNLSNIATDSQIAFPPNFDDGTEDGAAVQWESSDESVIKSDGTVIRPIGRDVEVTLTATTAAGEKISFVATVKGVEVESPTISDSSSCVPGGTVTASATIESNGNPSGKANLILAIYRPDTTLDGKTVKGEMIKGAVDIDEKAIASATTTFNCSVTIDSGLTDGLFARAFVWGKDLQPIANEITPAN